MPGKATGAAGLLRVDVMREKREQLNMTQKEMTAAAGMTGRRWQDIESGRWQDIRISSLAGICVALKMSPAELLQIPGLTPPPARSASDRAEDPHQLTIDDVIAGRSQPATPSTPFEEGRQARERGESNCQYRKGSRRRAEWQAGYNSTDVEQTQEAQRGRRPKLRSGVTALQVGKATRQAIDRQRRPARRRRRK